jgi:hypothetical protein
MRLEVSTMSRQHPMSHHLSMCNTRVQCPSTEHPAADTSVLPSPPACCQVCCNGKALERPCLVLNAPGVDAPTGSAIYNPLTGDCEM